MFIVYHPYIHPSFDWWLRLYHVITFIWLLQYGSEVCKFPFEKHDFPCKNASRVERVLLHDIEQGGQKQTGEFLLRPQASKSNSSVNLSTILLRFYMLWFRLNTKRYTNVLYFHVRIELVEGGFVSNTRSFVKFCWPMIIRGRNIKKKRNLLI